MCGQNRRLRGWWPAALLCALLGGCGSPMGDSSIAAPTPTLAAPRTSPTMPAGDGSITTPTVEPRTSLTMPAGESPLTTPTVEPRTSPTMPAGDGSITTPTAAQRTSGARLAEVQGEITSMLVDDGVLYWSTCEHSGMPQLGSQKTLQRLDQPGATAALLYQGEDCFYLIGQDEQHLYAVSRLGVGLLRFSKTDGRSSTVVQLPANPYVVVDLLLDGAHVYMSTCILDEGRGQIQRLPAQGGGATTVQDDIPCAEGLVLDGDVLYWTNGHEGRGRVMRAPKDGGAPIVLWEGPERDASDFSDLDMPRIVDVGPDDITFMQTFVGRPGGRCKGDGVELWVLPRAGGEPALLGTSGGTHVELALDQRAIYLQTDCRGIVRVDRRSGELKRSEVKAGLLQLEGDTLYWTNQHRTEIWSGPPGGL